MHLAEQWREIEAQLPKGWTSASLSLALAEDADPDRAALFLASLMPGRLGSSFRLEILPERDPGQILARLDAEGIRGRLDLVGSDKGPAEIPVAAPSHAHGPLAGQWGELLEHLPPDWSDLYAELELSSSDFLQRGALLLAPVNPARYGGPTVLRFRSARRAGYGVAPEMAHRCLERLDSERITGSVRILRVLSDTSLVATQGPVWRVGGRLV
ncbi:MAG: hypothetical protein ABI649_03545 [Gaiellaceae bacterium]